MYGESHVSAHDVQEFEERTVALQLPTLTQQKSTRGTRKNGLLEGGFVTSNQFEAQSYVESLPEIGSVGPQRREKMLRFGSDKTLDADNENACILRLPDIQKPYGCESLEEKRIQENGKIYSNNSELDKGLEGIHRNGVGHRVETCPLLLKNYQYQREMRYTRCTQKISRAKYSYFQRFPSPKPLNKREKLKKEMEERKPKKRDEPVHPGSLRTKEEYLKIFLSLKTVERHFVKKHKLSCRTGSDSPFFLSMFITFSLLNFICLLY